jgi:hypothetical protein
MTLRSLFAFAASNGGDCLLTRIILNPTIAGGTAEAYNAVSSDSAFEYDVACTGSVTGGTVLGSYLSKTHQENQVDLMRDFGGQPQIFKNFAGTSDKLCIAAGYHNGYGAGGDPYCYATFNWKELDG